MYLQDNIWSIIKSYLLHNDYIIPLKEHIRHYIQLRNIHDFQPLILSPTYAYFLLKNDWIRNSWIRWYFKMCYSLWVSKIQQFIDRINKNNKKYNLIFIKKHLHIVLRNNKNVNAIGIYYIFYQDLITTKKQLIISDYFNFSIKSIEQSFVHPSLLLYHYFV